MLVMDFQEKVVSQIQVYSYPEINWITINFFVKASYLFVLWLCFVHHRNSLVKILEELRNQNVDFDFFEFLQTCPGTKPGQMQIKRLVSARHMRSQISSL